MAVTLPSHTALLPLESQVARTEAPEALRMPLGPQEGRTGGSEAPFGPLGQLGHEGLVGLDAVDQPPQRDVEPARRPLSLEVPDVVCGLGDDVAHQPESIVDGQVGDETAQQRTRVQVGTLLTILDVAEHESHRGLGLKAG